MLTIYFIICAVTLKDITLSYSEMALSFPQHCCFKRKKEEQKFSEGRKDLLQILKHVVETILPA